MKAFIVQRVACFDPASIVVDAVRKDTADDHAPVCRRLPSDEEGRQQPGSEAEGCCSKTRKTFLEDTATIAISHRAVRLRALQRKAENRARCSVIA
ncbi:hypothetical protein SM0020_24348 [Sinorhizobium meliloti CCNWSX0020]|uniref:Uncharacterized protein n=1 Tax=Sinorhizobium meliloti CCNWSX0020 TaxID=1107881 RepID=H0G5V4_RHIML|nr:hypothetical protein SM0020_24348 [Sinorhizobium meliloti CCNWSX0020]